MPRATHEGPVAVITGAGGGIGRAVSHTLAHKGFRLVLAGRSLERLERTAEDIASLTDVRLVQCDVTDPASVRRLFDIVSGEKGRLDLLFNNAGIDHPGIAFDEVSFSQWNEIVATNVTGQFLCAQQGFRLMRSQTPQGGRIINNGSISAHTPRPNSIPYAMSKHAITGLTKGLMIDGRRFGIAACQVDIGNAADTAAVSATGSGEPVMDFADVSAAIAFMATLPPRANAPFVTIMATHMPYIGRG